MTVPIKYYYNLFSQPSRAIYIFLKQNKIPAEFHPVNLQAGEQKTDTFRKNVNRLMKVPAIVDNDFQLSESIAIVRYLSDRNRIDDHWYPENKYERARIDEYLEWHHLNTRLFGVQYFCNYFMKAKGNTQLPKFARTTEPVDLYINETLDDIEHLWLKPGRFISGASIFSFADVLAACEIEQLTLTGFNPNRNRPNLTEWFTYIRHLTNPAYDEANVDLNLLKQNANTK